MRFDAGSVVHKMGNGFRNVLREYHPKPVGVRFCRLRHAPYREILQDAPLRALFPSAHPDRHDRAQPDGNGGVWVG